MWPNPPKWNKGRWNKGYTGIVSYDYQTDAWHHCQRCGIGGVMPSVEGLCYCDVCWSVWSANFIGMEYKPWVGQRVTTIDKRGICRVADKEEEAKHEKPTSLHMEDPDLFVPIVTNEKFPIWQGWFNWKVMLQAYDHPCPCAQCEQLFLSEDDYLCSECRGRKGQ